MSNQFKKGLKTLYHAVLKGDGETSPELRQDVANYAISLSKNELPKDGRIPTILIPYINNIAKHAYKVSDRDIQRLKMNDFSEDEIFELSISAAFGAGLTRLECGLALLKDL